MLHHVSLSAREDRLLHLFKEVGGNLSTWGKDAGATYVADPIRKGNVPRAALGAMMLPISLIAEAPDYAIAGVVDQKLAPPPAVPFGRTRRDVGQLLKDVVSLRPLKSLADAARLAFTDLPLDGIETLVGYEHTGSVGRTQAATRGKMRDLSLAA